MKLNAAQIRDLKNYRENWTGYFLKDFPNLLAQEKTLHFFFSEGTHLSEEEEEMCAKAPDPYLRVKIDIQLKASNILRYWLLLDHTKFTDEQMIPSFLDCNFPKNPESLWKNIPDNNENRTKIANMKSIFTAEFINLDSGYSVRSRRETLNHGMKTFNYKSEKLFREHLQLGREFAGLPSPPAGGKSGHFNKFIKQNLIDAHQSEQGIAFREFLEEQRGILNEYLSDNPKYIAEINQFGGRDKIRRLLRSVEGILEPFKKSDEWNNK